MASAPTLPTPETVLTALAIDFIGNLLGGLFGGGRRRRKEAAQYKKKILEIMGPLLASGGRLRGVGETGMMRTIHQMHQVANATQLAAPAVPTATIATNALAQARDAAVRMARQELAARGITSGPLVAEAEARINDTFARQAAEARVQAQQQYLQNLQQLFGNYSGMFATGTSTEMSQQGILERMAGVAQQSADASERGFLELLGFLHAQSQQKQQPPIIIIGGGGGGRTPDPNKPQQQFGYNFPNLGWDSVTLSPFGWGASRWR